MDDKQKNLIKPISPEDAQRYGAKLTLGGKRLPDPYYQIPSENWTDDLSQLPDVTFPDIYMHCVHKVGQYTNQELKSMKSLEAYNYFKNGFVQAIQTAVCTRDVTSSVDSQKADREEANEVVFMKANVLPSQRVGEKGGAVKGMGTVQKNWRNSVWSLYMHGRVSTYLPNQ